MEIGKLTVQLRDNTGKGVSRKLRSSNMVPGVCYGVGMDQPLAICVPPKALKASLDPIKKNNTVLSLTIEKDGSVQKNVSAMVWDFQVHPTRQNVTHFDLKAIDTTKEIETEVPVLLVGKAKGSIDGGIISWERRRAMIRAKPNDIPATLDVDITELEIGGALHLSDVTLPEGVKFVSSTALTVCTCVAPRADKVAKGAVAETDEAAAAEGAEAPAAVKDGGKK